MCDETESTSREPYLGRAYLIPWYVGDTNEPLSASPNLLSIRIFWVGEKAGLATPRRRHEKRCAMWTQVVVFGAGAAVATLILLRRSKANGRLASPDPSVDWSTVTAAQLPPPSSIVPAGLLEHVGRWEGTYTHIAPDGTVTDKHECCLEIGIHGVYYSQRNTYVWRDDSGVETKREVHYFPGQVWTCSR